MGSVEETIFERISATIELQEILLTVMTTAESKFKTETDSIEQTCVLE
jgi:hypothetical protein